VAVAVAQGRIGHDLQSSVFSVCSSVYGTILLTAGLRKIDKRGIDVIYACTCFPRCCHLVRMDQDLTERDLQHREINASDVIIAKCNNGITDPIINVSDEGSWGDNQCNYVGRGSSIVYNTPPSLSDLESSVSSPMSPAPAPVSLPAGT
jgi:hypothetical protein